MADRVQIFTDGACRGNPGPGGWGAVLRYGDKEKTLHGGESKIALRGWENVETARGQKFDMLVLDEVSNYCPHARRDHV